MLLPFWRIPEHLRVPERIPPRKLNLTELTRFAEQMAALIDGSYSLSASRGPAPDKKLQWGDLKGLPADIRASVYILAESPAADDHPAGRFPGSRVTLTLQQRPVLGMVVPMEEYPRFHRELTNLWSESGRPLLGTWWRYPAALIVGLGLAAAGVVVAVAQSALSVLLLPLAVVALWTAYTVAAPRVIVRIEHDFHGIGPLPIDFRLLDGVKQARAESWEKWKDRFIGFATPLILGALGVAAKAAWTQIHH